jgi:hypothetical protein
MKNKIEELYEKAAEFREKHHDTALDEYLMSLAGSLQKADEMYHHFGYLVMHIRATVAHQVRPPHLQYAISRAERFLKAYEAAEEAGE